MVGPATIGIRIDMGLVGGGRAEMGWRPCRNGFGRRRGRGDSEVGDVRDLNLVLYVE